MPAYPSTLAELPLAQLRSHPDHSRKSFGRNWQDDRLVWSIGELGILTALVVSEHGDGSYLIVDGHRRYLAAGRAGLESVPCVVHPKLRPGDYAHLRWALNDTHEPWTKATAWRWWKKNRDALPDEAKARVRRTLLGA